MRTVEVNAFELDPLPRAGALPRRALLLGPSTVVVVWSDGSRTGPYRCAACASKAVRAHLARQVRVRLAVR